MAGLAIDLAGAKLGAVAGDPGQAMPGLPVRFG